MSARVFNPVIMSEMRRMLRGAGAGGSGGVACSESGGQAPATVATVGTLHGPDGAAIARVRRDLFGPVDHEDSRRLVDRELAAQQARDADRWGFDFARGSPRKTGPGTSRYVWEKVTPQEKIPEPYALRRMQYLSRCAVDDAPTPATTASEVVEATSVQEVATTNTNTKQSSITDFMKTRKRTCNATKPVSLATATEPKKARMSNS